MNAVSPTGWFIFITAPLGDARGGLLASGDPSVDAHPKMFLPLVYCSAVDVETGALAGERRARNSVPKAPPTPAAKAAIAHPFP
jgi:hypothetical protein